MDIERLKVELKDHSLIRSYQMDCEECPANYLDEDEDLCKDVS